MRMQVFESRVTERIESPLRVRSKYRAPKAAPLY